MVCEAHPKRTEFLERFKGTMHFDFGEVPFGYGWVFPKGDHLSVGALTASVDVKDLKEHLRLYLARKGLAPHIDIERSSAHLIPFWAGKGGGVAGREGLLVGDATGFGDPVTGEGLYYALKGARLATGAVLRILEHGFGHMLGYEEAFRRELVKDLVCARRMAYLLFQLPKIGHRLLRRHCDRLGQHMISITRGEMGYRQFQYKMPRFLILHALMFRRG
jgi:flavin-dependent dehydrogenase